MDPAILPRTESEGLSHTGRNESDSGPASGSFDLQVLDALRSYWLPIAVTTLIFAAGMLLLQAVSAPTYVATAVLSPSNSATAGPVSKLGRLASIAGIDLSSAKPASNFERFQYLLTSPSLAEFQIREHNPLPEIFADRWDPIAKRWRPAGGLGASIRAAINPIFGLPIATDPDAHTLATYYGRMLDQQKVPDTGMVRLVLRGRDPEAAEATLKQLIDDANEMLRREAAANAQHQAAYLRGRLAETQVQDYRATLIDLLTEQEQTLLLSNGSIPFAAELIEVPNSSGTPTKRPFLYGAIAGAIGFSLAAFVAIVLYNRSRYARAR